MGRNRKAKMSQPIRHAKDIFEGINVYQRNFSKYFGENEHFSRSQENFKVNR